MNNTSLSVPLVPGEWLGMLGGGQLGRMFCHAAQSLGYRVAVLDPDVNSPAGAVADWHLRCGYEDSKGLEQLAQRCRAVTTEFENIPAQTLSILAKQVSVRPGPGPVAIVQDRIREKAFFVEAGVPVAPYTEILDAAEIQNAPDILFPGILKAARFGYDGKGQARVSNREQAIAAWQEFGQVACVLEALMPLTKEISIILARDHAGNTVCYPPVQNEHRHGILAVSVSEALALQPELTQQASQAAIAIAEQLDYVGVMCVEYFVVEGNRLIVNEMAPRPHNSGHYTLDGSACSQFEQQVRVLAGMPLGPTHSVQPAIMLNILGDIWFRDDSDVRHEPAWHQVLAIPGAHLHLYGKSNVRRGRKMGHVNIVGSNSQQVFEAAAQVAKVLAIPFEL